MTQVAAAVLWALISFTPHGQGVVIVYDLDQDTCSASAEAMNDISLGIGQKGMPRSIFACQKQPKPVFLKEDRAS